MRTRSGDAVFGEAVPKCHGTQSGQFTVVIKFRPISLKLVVWGVS